MVGKIIISYSLVLIFSRCRL